MATECPLCGKAILKKGEKMVYCENYKPRKDGKDWFNEGECNFRIPYANKAFDKTLSPTDIKRLLDGEMLKNRNGDVMILDVSDETSEYFTRIEFAPKKEDRDF